MSRQGESTRLAAVLGFVGTIGLIIVGIISAPIVTTAIENTPPDTWTKVLATGFSIGGTVVGAFFIVWFFMIALNGTAKFTTVRRFAVTMNKTTLKPNETAIFEIDLDTRFRLLKGYILIMITNQYGELSTVTSHVRQTSPELIGDLRGFVRRTLFARWSVPENAIAGTYTARVALHDIRTDDLNFFKETDYVLRGITIPFVIESAEVKQLIVTKVTKVDGGICVRIENPTSINYVESTGRVLIDNEVLTLYDYKQYLTNMNGHAKKMDLYSIFDISNNSSKLLYAPTSKEVKNVTVQLDVGKETIEKDIALS